MTDSCNLDNRSSPAKMNGQVLPVFCFPPGQKNCTRVRESRSLWVNAAPLTCQKEGIYLGRLPYTVLQETLSPCLSVILVEEGAMAGAHRHAPRRVPGKEQNTLLATNNSVLVPEFEEKKHVHQASMRFQP
jgi:hypothetical protein